MESNREFLKLIAPAITISTLFFANRAEAEPTTTGRILKMCSGTIEYPGEEPGGLITYCTGHLDGINDLNEILHKARETGFYCQPQTNVSGEQGRQVFIRWVRIKPEIWHIDARS